MKPVIARLLTGEVNRPFIMRKYCFWLFPGFILFCFSCGNITEEEQEPHTLVTHTPPPLNLAYTIKMTYEHDVTAFTQGLVFYGDKVYESTGGEHSWIAVHAASGDILLTGKFWPKAYLISLQD